MARRIVAQPITGPKHMTDNLTKSTRVLYNAQCPVCNFEIKHYERYSSDAALPLGFDDLNSDALANWDLTADQAARRLYVLHKGALTSGIEGFLVLWAQMPRYRWLGRLVGCPGIKQIACAIYDHALAPAIYRWHLHRQARLARKEHR
jgi:predicted DCC family thiol-disulfide oxidoreductase YuxK